MSTTILIAHGHRTIRNLLAAHLQREGYDVTVTGSGAEALAHAIAREPKLVITDVVLVDRDGLALTEQLRKRFSPAKLPILFVSKFQPFADAALAAGANGYLVHETVSDWALLLIEIQSLLAA
ncbi:MAG: response regulator [Candidatus Kerfeldbacteria bacterium]|nr:response regulator [Candidatus Kerfeldbacteria bacterium]